MKLAWRTLRRQPGFTLVAVLTLSIGIGAATAIFSVANAVIFRPAASFSTTDVLAVRWVPGPRWFGLRKADPGLPAPYLSRGEIEAFAAERSDHQREQRVSWMVVDHAIHLVLIGLLPGVLLATWASRWLLVQNVRSPITTSLASWYVVPPLVLAVGVIAGFVPSRRAARVDPTQALRNL